MTPVSSIIRQAIRKDSDRLNIVTGPTHEAYETNLSKTDCNFYAVYHKSFKTWNEKYRPVPANYQIMKSDVLPLNIALDVVLSQNKFGQYQVLSGVAKNFRLPFISLEHTLPVPTWTAADRKALYEMRGDINVFISEYSVNQWGFDIKDPSVRVIHHGIDTDVFKPGNAEKSNHVLCVVNDWINRDWCCNFSGFRRTIGNLPCLILGDTPGLSLPAKSVDELVNAYQTSRIFYNTSTISPVPTALMEAMACGCAVVSTATCMIPEIIVNGVNGFMSNNEDELKKYLELLSNDEELAIKIGNAARETIINNFGLEKFKTNWNNVFREAAEINVCR